MLERRIVLVRHGRPAHAERGWYDAAGMRGWLAAYDAAGLAADDEHAAGTRRAGPHRTRSSQRAPPRAQESAARLAPGAPVW
jgi:hypothetical protein